MRPGDAGGNRVNTAVGYGLFFGNVVLLPLWLLAYRYSEKTYRVVVNASTGKVQGERPYSWVKITLTVLTVAAVVAAMFFIFGR